MTDYDDCEDEGTCCECVEVHNNQLCCTHHDWDAEYNEVLDENAQLTSMNKLLSDEVKLKERLLDEQLARHKLEVADLTAEGKTPLALRDEALARAKELASLADEAIVMLEECDLEPAASTFRQRLNDLAPETDDGQQDRVQDLD